MTKLLAQRELKTKFGIFTECMFDNQAIALVVGDPEDRDDVLCRVHSSCLSGHAFGSIECKCREEFETAQRLIQRAGLGVIVWLEQEGRGNGHLAVMKSTALKAQGMSQTEAYTALGFEADARSYQPAAEVLRALNVASIQLLTGNSGKADALRAKGATVSGLVELEL